MTTSLTSTTREPLVTARFAALTAAELAYFTAAGVAVLALPLHVTGPLGSGAVGAGVAFGAFAVSALLLRPVTGLLCDRWGRLPVMSLGAALAAAGFLGTAFAGSLGAVVALRLLLGVAEAAFFVAAVAAVADIVPAGRMGEAISYNSLGLYVGLAAGPPLGELLVRVGGFRIAWLGAAVLCVVSLAVVRLVGETRPTRSVRADDAPGGLIHLPAIAPGLGFLTSIVAMGAFLAFAPLYAGHVGLAGASLPMAVYGTTVVVGRVLGARYMDRLPPLRMGAAALAAMAAGLVLLGTVPTPAGLLAGSVVTAVGVVFSTPAFFAAIFATAGPERRGAASGTASIALDLGLAGGPVAAGLLTERSGIPAVFAGCAVVAGAGSAWTVLLARRALPRR